MPNYEHDCDSCVFLGEYRYANSRKHYGVDVIDLYYCPGEPTLIGRCGNDGGNYISGLVFALQCMDRGDYEYPLYEAFCRAQAMGIDVLNNHVVEDWANRKHDDELSERRWQKYRASLKKKV